MSLSSTILWCHTLSHYGNARVEMQAIIHKYVIVPVILCRKAIPTGILSGGMGQFLASPTDLVKTRLQMEGRRLLDGHKPRLISMALSFVHFNHHSDNWDCNKHWSANVLATSSALTTWSRYGGTWDAFRSILKSEGVVGLWRGWYPNCQRAAVACLGGELC